MSKAAPSSHWAMPTEAMLVRSKPHKDRKIATAPTTRRTRTVRIKAAPIGLSGPSWAATKRPMMISRAGARMNRRRLFRPVSVVVACSPASSSWPLASAQSRTM